MFRAGVRRKGILSHPGGGWTLVAGADTVIAMAEKVTVIGDGGMGTTCAIMLAENGWDVCLWSAFADAAERLARERENRRFLPGHPLPEAVRVTGADAEALAGADLVVSAVPTQYARSVWERLAAHCPGGAGICSVAKGIENGTLLRPTQILQEVLTPAAGGHLVAALSGPSIAPEVARKLPATVVVAAASRDFAERVQQAVSRPYFRVYTNDDLIGVEIAGATKNVVAIAAGILDGLSAGDNAKAALVSRGLSEITRLGVVLGALPETFAGLAGVGDLVTTCISPVGRNRSFGEAIGRGRGVRETLEATDAVVEGVATTTSVVELARLHGVEMPITQAVHDVLFGGVAPADAISRLMTRPLKAER